MQCFLQNKKRQALNQKIPYLGIFGMQFRKIIVIFEIVTPVLSKRKVLFAQK